MLGVGADVGEKFRGADEEALVADHFGSDGFSGLVRETGEIKVQISNLPLHLVDVDGEVLRDIAVKQHAKHVRLEVPAVHAAAKIIGDAPDGLVELGALGFFGGEWHGVGAFGWECGVVEVRVRPWS